MHSRCSTKNCWVSELMFHIHLNSTYSTLNLVSSSLRKLLFLLCTLAQSMAPSSRNDTQPRNELTLLSLIHPLFSISLLAQPIQPPKYPTYLIIFYPCCNYSDSGLILFSWLLRLPPPLCLSPFSLIYYGMLHKFACQTCTGAMLIFCLFNVNICAAEANTLLPFCLAKKA